MLPSLLALSLSVDASTGALPTPSMIEALPPGAVVTRVVEHRGASYQVVELDLRQVQLDLVGQRDGPHRFVDLPPHVAATNAGIFHELDEPVGLWVEAGVQTHALERAEGRGNFYLKPNGVFWIDADGAHAAATEAYVPSGPVRIATQSGPMLLMHGEVHPTFQPDSTSLKLRNAVAVRGPWTVQLVASVGPVRLHDLATMVRDVLESPDALYLDGTISGLSGPDLPPAQDRRDVAGFLLATPRPPATGLRDGDIVFQRSTSSQAAAIAMATGSDWTHTGVVRLVDGEAWVLEAVQPVRLTPFDRWAAAGAGGRVAVRRHVEADWLWSEAAVARLDALQAAWLGRDYDARFEPGDDRLYCSELVREAYLGAAGVELTPLRPVSSYALDDPGLRDAMVRRWGRMPMQLEVVAPSDLFTAEGLMEVPIP